MEIRSSVERAQVASQCRRLQRLPTAGGRWSSSQRPASGDMQRKITVNVGEDLESRISQTKCRKEKNRWRNSGYRGTGRYRPTPRHVKWMIMYLLDMLSSDAGARRACKGVVEHIRILHSGTAKSVRFQSFHGTIAF